MIQAAEILKEPGIQGVCGLLDKKDISASDPEGFILVIREIIEHFQITWSMTPLHEPGSGNSVENGFVLDLNGAHEAAANHSERTCKHCSNLMLALRIIGDWLFPPRGKCSFCEVQTHSNFVRADTQGQTVACATRALRLVSQLGARCPLGACRVWCMTRMTEQLNRIGAVELVTSPLSAERCGARI